MPFKQHAGEEEFQSARRRTGVYDIHWGFCFQQRRDSAPWFAPAGLLRGFTPGEEAEWAACERWCREQWGEPDEDREWPLRGWVADRVYRYVFIHDPDHAFEFRMRWS